MARYIDYDRMVDFVSACGLNTKLFEMKHKDEIVENVAPVTHANWENKTQCTYFGSLKGTQTFEFGICSDCNHFEVVRNYCGNCGAKMDKE